VDYFSPGYRELRRIILRAVDRWRLQRAQKHLAKVETELGLLGWQQADFDEDTQREVDKIMNFEREQARLTNESATVSRAIGELTAQRKQAQDAAKGKQVPIETQLATLRASLEKMDKDIAKADDELPTLERRAARLERESRDANKIYTEMLARESQTREQRDDLGRMRERIVSLPHEIADLHARRARLQSDLDARQKARDKEAERMDALVRELRQLEETHREEDEKLEDAIKTREREKQRLAKEHDALEREKDNPYRKIGQVLADSHVAPMNQPQALEVVRSSRFRMHEIEYEIAKSLADSKSANRTLIRHSLMLWVAIIVALVFIFAALLQR
jgi:chromosome segregation ATPase